MTHNNHSSIDYCVIWRVQVHTICYITKHGAWQPRQDRFRFRCHRPASYIDVLGHVDLRLVAQVFSLDGGVYVPLRVGWMHDVSRQDCVDIRYDEIHVLDVTLSPPPPRATG